MNKKKINIKDITTIGIFSAILFVITILIGALKRERYYGRRFTSKQELVQMIENYIRYYTMVTGAFSTLAGHSTINYTRWVQRNLGVLKPLEKHRLSLVA